MSEFGPPPEPAIPYDPPSFLPEARRPAPPPPPRHKPGSRAFIIILLVITCILLGAMLNWGLNERAERRRLRERNRRVEDAYTFVLAKRNDLAGFLTDPRTRQYRLEGRGDTRGHSVTVAWQQNKNSGVLIGDSMPPPEDGARYVVWLIGGDDGKPIRAASLAGGAASFAPEPGMTCFEFAARESDPKVRGFLVTQEREPLAASPGTVIYSSTADGPV